MASICLDISSIRFPPVEPTWEFPPLSDEPGAIYTWEVMSHRTSWETLRGRYDEHNISFPSV
jgi:hypothetical protein